MTTDPASSSATVTTPTPPLVQLLRTDLEAAGFSTWIDSARIKGGDDWRATIVDGLQRSSSVLGFLSRQSVRDPGVCQYELKIALGWPNVHVDTVLLEPENEVSPPAAIAHRQWLDMSEWAAISARGGSEWNDWYAVRLGELIAMIKAADPARLQGEINTLWRALKPAGDAGRDAQIARRPVMRRPWVQGQIEAWRTSAETAPLLLLGGPGTGKSVIAATLLYERRTREPGCSHARSDVPAPHRAGLH